MSIDTEQAVLGFMIYMPEQGIPYSLKIGMTSDWFDEADNREVFNQIHAEYQADFGIVDWLMIEERLISAGWSLSASQKMLDSCVDKASEISGFIRHCSWLKKRFTEREAGQELTILTSQLSTCPPEKTPELLAQIEDTARLAGEGTAEPCNLIEMAEGLLREYKDPVPPDVGLVRWPLLDLNIVLGPISDEVIWLAATESTGKTAFALQMAAMNAKRDIRVSFRSLESSGKKIVQRLISHLGQVNTLHLRQHRKDVTPFMMDRANQVVSELKSLRISMEDSPGNMAQVAAWADSECKRGSKLLIIDNVRHIQPDRRYNNPVEQFRDFSVRLKWIRDRTKVPIMILHHLTDEGDVAWSKDIRRDADILIYMFANEEKSIEPSAENNWRGRAVVEFVVKKNRDGVPGTSCEALFVREVQTFVGPLGWPEIDAPI